MAWRALVNISLRGSELSPGAGARRGGEASWWGGSDATIQQFVISVNDAQSPEDRFIVSILDPTHLFVKETAVPMLKERLNELMDENTYTFTD